MVSVDFEVLKEAGEIRDTKMFESLDEALSSYRDLYHALAHASEVIYGDQGEAFEFDLHITINPPYTITAKIFLV